MYRLTISDIANQDLDGIISYMAVDLSNPDAATDFLDELDKCYSHLEENPYTYAECSSSALRRRGYRKAVINRYILIFAVDESAKTVDIYRIFHGMQNYMMRI